MLSPQDLLRSASVRVAPQSFTLVAITREELLALLGDNSLSPRMTEPFMILMDDHEVTLVLEQGDLDKMRPGLTGARIEQGYRLLTFDLVLELSVVGFIAEVSRIMAEAGIAILPISAFSRDHLLIKQEKLATALKALGPHVEEIC